MLTLPPRGTCVPRSSEISKSEVPTQAYHRVKCHRRLTTTTPCRRVTTFRRIIITIIASSSTPITMLLLSALLASSIAMSVAASDEYHVEIRDGQFVFTYFHFAADRDLTEGMIESGAHCFA